MSQAARLHDKVLFNFSIKMGSFCFVLGLHPVVLMSYSWLKPQSDTCSVYAIPAVVPFWLQGEFFPKGSHLEVLGGG